MNVHNIMEDVVEKHVNNLYTEAKKDNLSWLTCDCENCRLDTISYVLNRIKPKYVVSGRGVNHSLDNWENHQSMADIEELAMQGMRIVNSTKRPFHSADRTDCIVQKVAEPTYNFPIITGTVLDGGNFEPVADGKVLLKFNGKEAEMVDKTWTNPYITCKSTNGSYTFWIKSIPAKKAGLNKIFNMTLEVTAEGYDSVIYNFELPIISDEKARTELNSNYTITIQNLVLFRKKN